MADTKHPESAHKIHLIVTDEKEPKVQLPQGGHAKVVSVSLVEPTLAHSHVTAARLCGGTSTCVALFETGETEVK